MDITFNFERKGIFGNRDFCSDTKENASLDDLKNAVRAFRKDWCSALHITTDECSYCLLWYSLSNYELELIKVTPYTSWNNSGRDFEITYATLKKEIAKAAKRERASIEKVIEA